MANIYLHDETKKQIKWIAEHSTPETPMGEIGPKKKMSDVLKEIVEWAMWAVADDLVTRLPSTLERLRHSDSGSRRHKDHPRLQRLKEARRDK